MIVENLEERKIKRYPLGKIKNIEKVSDISRFMKQEYFYFKIEVESDPEDI